MQGGGHRWSQGMQVRETRMCLSDLGGCWALRGHKQGGFLVSRVGWAGEVCSSQGLLSVSQMANPCQQGCGYQGLGEG